MFVFIISLVLILGIIILPLFLTGDHEGLHCVCPNHSQPILPRFIIIPLVLMSWIIILPHFLNGDNEGLRCVYTQTILNKFSLILSSEQLLTPYGCIHFLLSPNLLQFIHLSICISFMHF